MDCLLACVCVERKLDNIVKVFCLIWLEFIQKSVKILTKWSLANSYWLDAADGVERGAIRCGYMWMKQLAEVVSGVKRMHKINERVCEHNFAVTYNNFHKTCSQPPSPTFLTTYIDLIKHWSFPSKNRRIFEVETPKRGNWGKYHLHWVPPFYYAM